MKRGSVGRLTRRVCLLLAAAPLLQVSACQSLDLTSAFSVGLANFTINQSTTAFDTIIRNLIGL